MASGLRLRAFGVAVSVTLAAAMSGACGDDDGSAAGRVGDRLLVVTTVAPITSIVANVVGDRAEIRGVVPEGTNSHTFEPPPSVAEALARADVVFLNGLGLEEPTRDLARDHLRAGAELIELGDRAIPEDRYRYDFSFPREGGRPNPHTWTDPTIVVRYSEVVRDTMAKHDPSHADEYAANQAAFAVLIARFDAAMRAAFATIPPERRKLLTYHDAFAYFAGTYGWTVTGAIQPSHFGEPTAREVAALIEQVKREGVPVIFGSEVFPSPVLARIGQEAGVRYVDTLRDDDLPGEPGDPEHSWLGLLRFDFVTMAEALGGDATALREFPVDNVAPDRALYPQ
jgi:ABC-type Zn uptake system ZnuABC Zn-binding protein ZnuA